MHILLTNDDGVDAVGLYQLAFSLHSLAKISIVAPAFEQSCTGHGITVNAPLRLHRANIPHSDQSWAVQGTPADCVKMALEHILKDKPDLVISGINHGSNLGTDAIYSGTVSGAMEGYIYGLPAIAVSSTDAVSNFDLAAEFIKKIILWWKEKNFSPAAMLNINVPPGKIKGAKYTKLGFRTYENAFEERIDPMGRKYFWLHGKVVDRGDMGKTDVEAVSNGFISVSPLQFDITDYITLNQLQKNQTPSFFDEPSPNSNA